MTEVSASEISKMVKVSKKRNSTTALDASPSSTSYIPGSIANSIGSPGAAHAQTHQPENLPIRHGTTSVPRPKAHHGARPEHSMAPMDPSMDPPDQAMGQFALANSSGAARHTTRPAALIGSVAKSKMQKHLQLLRRNGIMTNPIEPGVAITGPVMSSSQPMSAPWRSTLWSPQRMSNEDQEVVRELDHDVAGALVAVGGTLMGIPAQELLNSPGMRKLVARNIRWFQGTHDVVKMVGLMAAKKLNQWVTQKYGGEENLRQTMVGVKRERAEEDSDMHSSQKVFLSERFENLPIDTTTSPFVPKPLRIHVATAPRDCEEHKKKDDSTMMPVDVIASDVSNAWSMHNSDNRHCKKNTAAIEGEEEEEKQRSVVVGEAEKETAMKKKAVVMVIKTNKIVPRSNTNKSNTTTNTTTNASATTIGSGDDKDKDADH